MQCHANVPAPEETEEQLDFQGLRYSMSKKGNIFFDVLLLIKIFFYQKLILGCFVFKGSPGSAGSQGHPGDEGGPVSLNA